MGDEKQPQSSGPSDRAMNRAIPLGSTFNDLFSGGAPVWMKMIGGGVACPVLVATALIRSDRRDGVPFSLDPSVFAAILAGCAVLGVFLGAALSLKDVVHARLVEGKPVAFPIKALFGFGVWSLLLVWFPFTIVITLVVTMVAISLNLI